MSYFTDPKWFDFSKNKETNDPLFEYRTSYWNRYLPSFAKNDQGRGRKKKKYCKKPHHMTFACSDYDVHTVTIWPNLQIKWHNHDLKEIKKKVMAYLLHIKGKNNTNEMRKHLCGCEQVYLKIIHPELVSRYDIASLATEARQWLEDMGDTAQARKNFNDQLKKVNFKTVSDLIKEELSRHLVPLMNSTLNYRAPGGRYNKIDYNFVITSERTPSMEVDVVKTFKKTGWNRQTAVYDWKLNCFLPPSWYMAIYKKNLWNFQGNLVLEIKKKYDHDMVLALLGKQSNGSIVRSSWAILNYEFNTIRWIDDKTAEEFIQTDRVPRRMSPRVKEEKPSNEESQTPSECI